MKWTAIETHRLLTLMRTCYSWDEVAVQVGRTARACAQKAHVLGHYLERPHTGPTVEQVQVIRDRHADGWSDADIAQELRRDRRIVCAWRRNLGLPSNTQNERHRAKTRAALRRQLAADGFDSLAELRHIGEAADAVRHGWPADATPLMCEILDYLEHGGGTGTRRGFCTATGRKYKAATTTGGASAFQALIDRGHIERLPGRTAYKRGRGATCVVYRLRIRRRNSNMGKGVDAA